mmetsp:Transcript_52250/g.150464  ORF Transcript_52250/g.150464 Transcript_52250/m.150464 type:complete len:224 (-) Transcript_52250:590-1261(-)
MLERVHKCRRPGHHRPGGEELICYLADATVAARLNSLANVLDLLLAEAHDGEHLLPFQAVALGGLPQKLSTKLGEPHAVLEADGAGGAQGSKLATRHASGGGRIPAGLPFLLPEPLQAAHRRDKEGHLADVDAVQALLWPHLRHIEEVVTEQLARPRDQRPCALVALSPPEHAEALGSLPREEQRKGRWAVLQHLFHIALGKGQAHETREQVLQLLALTPRAA